MQSLQSGTQFHEKKVTKRQFGVNVSTIDNIFLILYEGLYTNQAIFVVIYVVVIVIDFDVVSAAYLSLLLLSIIFVVVVVVCNVENLFISF